MSVVVTPRGTRGFEWRRLPRPLMSAMFVLFHLAYRTFGDRMRVQGRPLLELETVGAKSGARRHTVLGWFPEAFAEPAQNAPEPIEGQARNPRGRRTSASLAADHRAGTGLRRLPGEDRPGHPDRSPESAGGRALSAFTLQEIEYLPKLGSVGLQQVEHAATHFRSTVQIVSRPPDQTVPEVPNRARRNLDRRG